MPRILIFLTIIVLVAVGAYYVTRRAPSEPAPVEQVPEQPAAEEIAEQPAEPLVDGVRFEDYPEEVPAGNVFSVGWRVTSETPGTINHTSVHYGTASRAGTFGSTVAPSQSGYASLVRDFMSGTFQAPGTFTANITAPSTPGTVYLRAHAVINGQNYWTDEVRVNVK